MARPISDEELQLKKRARRRLVGAIVLVTAVAVILPMVLDTEPKPVGQNVDIQIPSPDSGDFKPKASAPIRIAPEAAVAKAPDRIAPVPAVPKAPETASKADARTAPAVAIPNPAPSVSVAEVAKSDSTPDKPAAPEKATKEQPKPAPKQVAGGAYAVQVEALADAAKAKQLEKKVATTGLQTYTQVISTKAGEVTRVRAGPYATREAAEKAREQLKAVGLDGKVVPK
jgi:DedD protein